MPTVINNIKNHARHINARHELPGDPLPLDKAIAEIRRLLIEASSATARVALAVWLYKKLTNRDPMLTTVVSILNYTAEEADENPAIHQDLSQNEILDAIHDLLARKEKDTSAKGVLILQDEGNRISLNRSLETQLNRI